MPIKTGITTKGGERLKAILAKAEQSRVSKIKVGYMGNDKYPDGTPLVSVAVGQNFGEPKAGIPERPFFSQAASIMRQDLPGILLHTIDPKTLTVGPGEARVIGAWAIGIIQERALALKLPPNAASTLAEKQGNNPLVDTGKLATGATYDYQGR